MKLNQKKLLAAMLNDLRIEIERNPRIEQMTTMQYEIFRLNMMEAAQEIHDFLFRGVVPDYRIAQEQIIDRIFGEDK